MISSSPATPPQPFGALRHRNFRFFIAGQFVSLSGTWMQSVALGWLVLELTNSAALVGLVTALGAAPILLFTLYGGLVADRVDKRRMLMLLQTGMLLDATLLGTLTVFGLVTPLWIMAITVLHGTLAAFEIPIRQSFLLDLVGRDDLMNAISLNSAAFNLSRVFGPALAGAVLATLGAAPCFYLNAVSFLAVLYGLSRIRVLATARADRPRPRFLDGVTYVASRSWTGALILVTATVTICGAVLVALLPVYARDLLATGAAGYGGLSAAFGVGAASGALLIAGIGPRLRRGPVAFIAAAGLGVGLALIAISRFYPVALLLVVGAGLALALNAILTNSTLQLEAPDHLRNQVVALYAMIVVGVAPLAALPAGWLADRMGLTWVLGMSGLVVLIAAGVGGLTQRGKTGASSAGTAGAP